MSIPAHKLFVPFSEDLLDRMEVPIGELVPFQLEYECVHFLVDGQDGQTEEGLEKTAAG